MNNVLDRISRVYGKLRTTYKLMFLLKLHKYKFQLAILILFFVLVGVIYFNNRSSGKFISTINNNNEEHITFENTQEGTKIDNSKTVFFDSEDHKYKFVEDTEKLVVRRGGNFYDGKLGLEIGIYKTADKSFETLVKSGDGYLQDDLSPNNGYLIVSQSIQDPNSEINYHLVQSMMLIDLKTRVQLSIPFPKNLMWSGTLWDLNKRKVYITARKPEGLDFSYKWYYKYNLDSGYFRLIATSDDFTLDYGPNSKKISNYAVSFRDIDRTGNNIIAIGAGGGDPVLSSVWKINPETRAIDKLFDSNVNYTDANNFYYVSEIDVENNKIILNNVKQLFSMNLTTGEITSQGEYSEASYVFNNERYSYIPTEDNNTRAIVKDENTNKIVSYPFAKEGRYLDYRIEFSLD